MHRRHFVGVVALLSATTTIALVACGGGSNDEETGNGESAFFYGAPSFSASAGDMPAQPPPPMPTMPPPPQRDIKEIVPTPTISPGFANLLPSSPGKSIDETVNGVLIKGPLDVDVTGLSAEFGATEVKNDGKTLVFPMKSMNVRYSYFLGNSNVDVKVKTVEISKGKIVVTGDDTTIKSVIDIKFPITMEGKTVYIGDTRTPCIQVDKGNVKDRDGNEVLPMGIAVAFNRQANRVLIYKVEDGSIKTDKVLLSFPLK